MQDAVAPLAVRPPPVHDPRIDADMTRPEPRTFKRKAFEILLFAGVLFVVHLLASAALEAPSFSDLMEGPLPWAQVRGQVLDSLIVVSLAAPAYLALMSWYRKSRFMKGRSIDRDTR